MATTSNLLMTALLTSVLVVSIVVQAEYQHHSLTNLTFAAILPKTSLITVQRSFYKRLYDAVDAVRSRNRYAVFNFTNFYRFNQVLIQPMPLAPTPTEILTNLCGILLPKGPIAILYFTNAEVYGSNAASVQYLLQLIGYVGIPVIAWNTDNVGLEQRVTNTRILQLAPSVDHQAASMLSVLRRYNWRKFAIVTSAIGGHLEFVRAIRDHVINTLDFQFEILKIFSLRSSRSHEITEELEELANSETRIVLLYCSQQEAVEIMQAANDLELTGRNYVWIVTQSVIGTKLDYSPGVFPPGMLGVHFSPTIQRLLEAIDTGVSVLTHGVENFVNDPANANLTLGSTLPEIRTDCKDVETTYWKGGEAFFRSLRSVSVKGRYGQPAIEFNSDGTLKHVELDIMNLDEAGIWVKIGAWSPLGLDIKDVVWPGDSPVPPRGVPEKFTLKATFLDEPPYIKSFPSDNVTGLCPIRAVRCRVATDAQLASVNVTEAYKNPEYFKCCTGFCIDLLNQFAEDLGFTFDLYRVQDGTWGAPLNNGTWTGLISELLSRRADIVVTSFKINSQRQAVADFSIPFLETGIAIVVAKRTGIISPKAFLEPFDALSWLMILVLSIHTAAFFIFILEWISPSGYNMKLQPPSSYKFSLGRANWLVWALLFGAAVNVDCPRGFTARFMANVWAFFSVIFLAIYTANLATFMITREEHYELTGIEDKLLQNPYLVDPAFRFGTIPFGNTETVLKTNKPQMYSYMRQFNRSKVDEGIRAVKSWELDAFIYDATVLEYLVGQDNECRLLTVGSWYAMTGYGFAFYKNSKYLDMFDRKMIEYREIGYLERLRDFWLQGACKPKQSKRNASHPLDVNQFMSAFLLLGCGILLTGVLLFVEFVYFRYLSRPLIKSDRIGCCSLVSRNMCALQVTEETPFPEERRETRRENQQTTNGCVCSKCETALIFMKKELELTRRQNEALQRRLQKKNAAKKEKKKETREPQSPVSVDTIVAEIETVL